ncbi:transcription repressor OFP13-like [Phragmites australis]|uniref:transcription repressor OFP13-like n=1 Tax=Phragmites australis TaxID=29695 RepID=UPI002D77595E|nr:transcription repressor OFP13-like [Phragmites australis]
MVKKLALMTSLFFNSSETSMCPSSPPSMSTASFSTAASWQWPSCMQARTLSIRVDSGEIVSMRHDSNHKQQEEYKTSMNPAYVLDSTEYYSCSLSTAPEQEPAVRAVADEDEVIVRGLRSNNRIFFEPESTSSIVSKAATAAAFGGATALAIESADPYGDFRRSMEEMMMSHGVNDWGWLEEMLGWYLSANGKKTHGLIVGAFVDLLVALASAPSPACSSSLMARHQAVKKGKHQTR